MEYDPSFKKAFDNAIDWHWDNIVPTLPSANFDEQGDGEVENPEYEQSFVEWMWSTYQIEVVPRSNPLRGQTYFHIENLKSDEHAILFKLQWI